jgi:hypothetical protein
MAIFVRLAVADVFAGEVGVDALEFRLANLEDKRMKRGAADRGGSVRLVKPNGVIGSGSRARSGV